MKDYSREQKQTIKTDNRKNTPNNKSVHCTLVRFSHTPKDGSRSDQRHWLEVTMYAGEKYMLSCRMSANCSSETEYIQSDVNSIECKMYIEIISVY